MIETILPILLVRDRNYEDFYYTQIERMLVTNSKIINFYKTLTNVMKKIEQERNEFLQHMVYEYRTYEEEKKLCDPQLNVRRQFSVYCVRCQRVSKTFEISEAERLKICTKCKK